MSSPAKTGAEDMVYSCSDITAAPWNANVMEKDLFDQLLADMKQGGPGSIDAVHIAKVRRLTGEEFVVTCDGAHRLKAARELGWPEIPVVFHHEITTEAQARIFNYKRDAERGSVDPFKLAETFRYFVKEQGKTQEQVAEIFGVDRTTVSRRLGLLGVDPQVRKYAIEKHGMSVSHLEPIMGLAPAVQRQVMEEAVNRSRYDGVTAVQQVAKSASWIQTRMKREAAFAEMVASAKVKKCPQCHKPPSFQQHQDDKNFRCENLHVWNPSTGKDPNRDRPAFNPRRGDYVPSLPQHIKLEAEADDFSAAAWNFIAQLMPKMKGVKNMSSGGTLKDGRSFGISFHDHGYNSGTFSFEAAGDPRIEFRWAGVEKATPAFKEGFRTRVSGKGDITKKEQLEVWTREATKFLQDYGVPHGTSKKRSKR